ncbi:PQQ-dependent sugar dehydrogenase [Aeromicrobium sp. CF4.19]|uniref:PQQ-dependent sugar dehydrogenase n=1 Tax=Aeromicrobium sp. CF4.19 TaxID=3373082 RepID=UPI003EE7D767
MRKNRARTRLIAGLGALAVGLALVPGVATADRDEEAKKPRPVTVVPGPTAQHWDPLTPEKWAFEKGQVVQTERGEQPEGPRRPFEYATVSKGPDLASLDLSAQVRIDEPVSRDDRDVVLIWNYQSPTRFYYAHLSQDNGIYAHNGIFVVDDEDRRRIDDQWDGERGAEPAIDDLDWHDVRLTYDAPSGEVAVRMDGEREPLMTATDTTFSGGRMGFGSFDNHGRIKGLKAKGVSAADQPDPDAPITDPVPEDPAPADLALELEEVAQLPESEPTPEPTDPRIMRHNRINFIGEVPDDSGRRYVPDLNGPMYLLDEEGRETEYLDVREHDEHFFSGRGMGSGFGFVTFHPEFAENGKFYTTHTVSTEGIEANEPTYPNQPDAFVQSVVTEWTADDPAAQRFSGTTREVFRFGFTQQIHAIQQIDFNPTATKGDEDYGLLYLAVGDGGIGVGSDVPQDMGTPAGKLLRIDPLGDDGPNGQYGIPDSNPFVGDEGALGEIYALGFRDPHRFSWDPANGRMFLGHIGQHAIEAVYEIDKGDNAGWSEIEGRLRYDNDTQCHLFPLTEELQDAGYIYPVASYDHDVPANWDCNADSGHAISGGQAYRGPVKELRGRYVFGDLVNGSVYSTEVKRMRQGSTTEAPITELALQDTDGNRMRMTDFVDDVRVDLRFGTDAEGDLYLLAKSSGTIWKVTDAERVKQREEVDPRIADHLVSFYDFERGFAQDAAKEEDRGSANLLLDLVNGAGDMRVRDAAYPGSVNALQTRQVSPTENGNDDWKAGLWDEDGIEALDRFSGAKGISVMGWFKMTGDHPAPDSTTPDTGDRYNAVGLAGLLSGDSDGHGVRALLELIDVDGELRLVALGRRLDEGASRTFAAAQDWQEILPKDEWVHLAATFDYTSGEMALYRNGKPLEGFYTDGGEGDPWELDGTGTSPTLPKGIKIGGSYPQNSQEKSPCDCRMDALMLLDDALDRGDVARQYRRFVRP